jgi:hypothetical protein
MEIDGNTTGISGLLASIEAQEKLLIQKIEQLLPEIRDTSRAPDAPAILVELEIELKVLKSLWSSLIQSELRIKMVQFMILQPRRGRNYNNLF